MNKWLVDGWWMTRWMDEQMDGYLSSPDSALASDSGLICSALQERSSGASLSFPVTSETRWTWDASTSGRGK